MPKTKQTPDLDLPNNLYSLEIVETALHVLTNDQVREILRQIELRRVGERLPQILAKKTKRKIEGFKGLQAGWCYGDGVKFNTPVIERTLDFNYLVASQGFTETDAFPGIGGDIRLTVYLGEHYLEFTFNPDGSVDYARELGDEEVESSDGLTHNDAEEILSRFKDEAWDSLDIFTGCTSTPGRGDLQVRLFNHLAAGWESQLYTTSASKSLETRSASTLGFTTQPSPASP